MTIKSDLLRLTKENKQQIEKLKNEVKYVEPTSSKINDGAFGNFRGRNFEFENDKMFDSRISKDVNSRSSLNRQKRNTRNILGRRDESAESFGPGKYKAAEEDSDNADTKSIGKSRVSRESKRSIQK